MDFDIVLNMARLDDETPMQQVWDKTNYMVRLADEAGFTTAWTAEHHTIELTIAPNPFQLLSHWAAITKNIRLGTGIVTAPYWHPIRLAGEAGLCDLISGGRLEFGIGRGSFQYEFDRMQPGIDQREGVGYMKEMLAALKELWKGDYAHDGQYWQFPTATACPKPQQLPHPPLWCAARDPGSFDWAISNGCNIMATPLQAPHSEVEVLVNRFNDTVARYPELPRPKLMMLRRVCVYDNPDDWMVPVEGVTNFGRYFETLMKNIGGVENGFADPADYQAIANKNDYDPKSLHENMLFGTPEEVVVKLKKYEALGIDTFLYGEAYGVSDEFNKRSLELFASEVMPHFQ